MSVCWQCRARAIDQQPLMTAEWLGLVTLCASGSMTRSKCVGSWAVSFTQKFWFLNQSQNPSTVRPHRENALYTLQKTLGGSV